MIARIAPAPLSGTIAAIPSKSETHRLLILSALCEGETRLIMDGRGDDIDATIGCLRALGAGIDIGSGHVTVRGRRNVSGAPQLDCRESGSTLRFLLPVAAVCCDKASFTGRGRLPERPIGELVAVMRAHGVAFSAERLPFSTVGRLIGGSYELPGNVSSQYLTGLLLALPLAAQDSRIALTTKLESAAYLDITLAALRTFGASVSAADGVYGIPGGQRYASPGEVAVGGDWSNAAFFLAAGALGNPVRVTGLDPDSAQGDRRVLGALRRFGADVTIANDCVAVARGRLTGCELDVSETPDLLPALAVVAANAEGETRFVNAARLRLKESDRLTATTGLVNALGGSARELPDGLIVRGGPLLGGTVDSCHDHRIAMAAAVAAVHCTGSVTIRDAGAVNKSYPAFFEDYARLGGIVDVV